jgi:hypothetical protein
MDNKTVADLSEKDQEHLRRVEENLVKSGVDGYLLGLLIGHAEMILINNAMLMELYEMVMSNAGMIQKSGHMIQKNSDQIQRLYEIV